MAPSPGLCFIAETAKQWFHVGGEPIGSQPDSRSLWPFHGAYGTIFSGGTLFANAALLGEDDTLKNRPIVIDIARCRATV
jgi:hypothetical protein